MPLFSEIAINEKIIDDFQKMKQGFEARRPETKELLFMNGIISTCGRHIYKSPITNFRFFSVEKLTSYLKELNNTKTLETDLTAIVIWGKEKYT